MDSLDAKVQDCFPCLEVFSNSQMGNPLETGPSFHSSLTPNA